jgi:DNA-binding CsgD family transcriptional regulator
VISFVTGPERRARESGAEAEARMHAALQRAEVSENLVARSRPGGVWSLLSPREREIAGMLMKGNRPSEIAGALGLSVHTVRNHLRLVYRKLGVHSQIELLARLRESRET